MRSLNLVLSLADGALASTTHREQRCLIAVRALREPASFSEVQRPAPIELWCFDIAFGIPFGIAELTIKCDIVKNWSVHAVNALRHGRPPKLQYKLFRDEVIRLGMSLREEF